MTGSFVLYITGFLTIFRAVSIFMVLDDHHPIVRLIFQMGPHEIEYFIIGFFHFELLQTHQDTCIYRVCLDPFNGILCFVGVDAD